MVKVTQLRVDETLRNIATEKCDHKIVALTSREIVAAEAHSCYHEYTRPKKQGLGCDISDDTQYAEFDALSDLFEHIRAEVLEKQRVIPMTTEVTNQFALFSRQRGIEKVRETAKKHIKRKIAAEFGTTLEIFPSSRGKLIVMPANLSLKETDPVPPPTLRVQSLVKSFSQDIVYAVTNGKIKPPKQVLLSYGVKTLTGNVELIQILSRLRHGVSYSKLEKNDTALFLEKMAAAINESAILPDTIRPNVFTNLAWDNVDRLEETLTAGGTSHRVNGIVVQPKVYGPYLPKASLPAIRKQKQRSITQEVPSLCTYISGERVGPPQTQPPRENAQHKAEADIASKKNFI